MARSAITRQIRTIEQSFNRLASAFRRLGVDLAASPGTSGRNGDGPARKSPRLTAERRAALKLQGQYMGTLRGLKPNQQAQVKRIRARKGIAAALKAAARLSS